MSETTIADAVPALDHIPRMTREQIAHLRGFACSRWAACLFAFGDVVLPPERQPFGYDDTVIAVYPPELGPTLAESSVGIPFNLARRVGDLMLVHWWPEGQPVRGFHSLVMAGVVEHAWATPHAVMGTILVLPGLPPGLPESAHDLLAELDATGLLGLAGLCLGTNVDHEMTRTPTGALVAIVRRARATKVDLVAHTLRPGSRIVRRLAMEEEPTDADSAPTEPLLVPRAWYSAATPRLRAATPTDIDPGAIATGNLAAGAVTPTKRSPLLTMSQSVGIPPGGPLSMAFTHNLGLIPHITIDTSDPNIAAWPVNITTTQVTVVVYNYGPLVTRTITGYAW